MRKSFHQHLEELTEDVLKMGSLSQEAVHNVIQALIEMNPDLAQEVIDGDVKIDEYDILIEEKSIVLQAEHQPVAKDLRLLHSISIIIIHLERIGDLAVNIARVIKKLSHQKDKFLDKEILDLLVEMGNLVQTVLKRSLESFAKKDYKLASKLDKIDAPVDDLQKMVLKKLYTSISGSEEYVKFITNVSLVSRYLERIGDQSVNIGERVQFFLTGDYRMFHEEFYH
ncbi:MAG: phosphate signaling complex protein PhoU [Actinomycetota bacterium]|nr:phosphate signaling complex protein PhoU [Actinomycetota bacterium]